MAAVSPAIESENQGVPQKVEKAGLKKLVRRAAKEHSQALRFGLQAAFLCLNIAIGLKFLLFVRYFESGGQSLRVSRPAGVDGWLPIGGMMNLKYLIVTRVFPRVHPAAMVLLSCFLVISILFRKAFCSWLCPVGTISEALWKLGRKYLRINWHLPRWADLPLRGLKYVLLGFFLAAVGSMSAKRSAAFWRVLTVWWLM